MFSRGRKHQKNHKKITRTPSLMRYDISKKNCGRRRKINVRRTALRGVSMRLILTTFSPIPVPRSRKTQSGENSFPDPDPVILTGNPIAGGQSDVACLLFSMRKRKKEPWILLLDWRSRITFFVGPRYSCAQGSRPE